MKIKALTIMTILLLVSITSIALPVKASLMVFTADSLAQYYKEQETILSGLSEPFMEAIDTEGRIYFTETIYTENGEIDLGVLKRYDPETGIVEEIVSYDQFIRTVRLDLKGNLYYIVGDFFDAVPDEIHKLPTGATSSVVLYESEYPYGIVDLDVDLAGNLFFCMVTNWFLYDPPYTSKLMAISEDSNTAVQLVQFTVCARATKVSGISKVRIQLIPFLGNIVYLAVHLDDGVYIYKYAAGKLEVILKRETAYRGGIIIELSRYGNLYYLYRQTSELPQPPLWGYLEIGRFFMPYLPWTRARILMRANFDERVMLWSTRQPFEIYEKLDMTADIFVSVTLWTIENDELIITADLLWFNSKTGEYTIIASSEEFGDMLPFVVDKNGNVYYSKVISGDIVRINR